MNTDHDVIARSLREPAAFADLFDRHAATVYRYACSRSTRQVADDLLSETFLVTTRLAKLPRGDLDVVILYAWEELTYEQISHALGIPVGTVRSRLNRARTKLGAALPRPTHSKEAGHGLSESLA